MSSGQLDEFAALDYNHKVVIDDLCDEFEAAFESGQTPEARSYLQRSNKTVWPILIRELLSIEIAHHTESKAAIVDQYLDSFPELHEAIRSCVPSSVIEPGQQLGDFRIERQIGAGGMGIVYEAQDTKLDRRVALKFLTAEFTSDRARLDRFEREAKILAGLNHPNIATLYGFDVYENRPFCVLEFVPGLMLAERLQRGRVSARETISIFTQIANALEAAHESGVIHRDLKPANIKITDEGMVKVLDFGLATSVSVKNESMKATSDGRGDLNSGRPGDLPSKINRSNAEVTGFAGTLPYMSPEQVSGGTVDKRSDIWSFGCCLFETLTGKRAFCSQDTTELLDSIQNAEPDWLAMPNEVPQRLLQLVRRCLRKDARERLRDMGDARIELLDCEQDAAADREFANPTSHRWKWAAVTGFMSTLLFAGLVLRGFVAPVGQEPFAQTAMSVNLPDGLQIHDDSLTISPDGSSIAFAAIDENGLRHLHVRQRSDFEIRKLEDTEGGMNPFFSPDGQRIGFIGSNRDTIKIVSFSGGDATTVCRTVGPIHGGCWCQDGKLRFSSSWGSMLEEVNPDGAGHKQLNRVGARFPQQLPNSDALLFQNGKIWSPSTETANMVDLTDDRVDAVRYVQDHLVYSQGGSLFSVAVELDPPQKVGRPQLLFETDFDWLNFDVSELGDIAVMQGCPRDAELVWRKRGTKSEVPAWDGARRYGALQLSPDGTKLATGIKTDNRWTVWVYDFRTSTGSILAREGESTRPVWTPDGKRIIFRWRHSGRSGLAWKGVGSQQAPTWLLLDPSTGSSRLGPRATFLRDGKTKLLYNGPTQNQHSKRGIVEFDLHDQTSRGLIATQHSEAFGELSPDGKWLLYLSDHDTTRFELFITNYPGLNRTHRISQHGAIDPIWSDSSDVVYYRCLERWDEIIAATLQFDPFLVEHETIFSGTKDCLSYSFDYDAPNDRFLVLSPVEASSPRNEIRWLRNALQNLSKR